MTDKLYELMNWADVEEVCYLECSNPKRILGARLLPEGLLIQAFFPTAKEVSVMLSGKAWPMERADEAGFFAVLLPEEKRFREKLPDYRFRLIYDNDTEETLQDPYRFPSIYTEEDIRKFEAGIHYRIYEKMGAHPISLGGTSGVVFSVWAPGALRVSVVGDFNLWDGRRNMMQKISDNGIFELFLPGLSEGTIYKYEILRHGQEPFLKTDPYGFSFELRPNTASVVSDLRRFHWEDRAWQERKKRGGQKTQPMSVYELHLGSVFRKKLTVNEDGSPVPGSEFYNYRELAEKIASYVKAEGYTHVELMPVMEHPLDQSWGYQITGYYAPSSRFGSPEDFQYLVDRLHQEGIGVILDWAPAHFPRDSWGLASFDGGALYEDPDPVRGSHPHWGSLIFHYARHEVSNFLIANAFFWAEKYHVDGIRMDAVASMLYLDYGRQGGNAPRNMYGGNENLEAVEFLKHLNSQFRIAFPGTLLIAEESTAWENVTLPVEEGGLGFDLKWNMGWMNDFLSYMQTDPFFRKQNYRSLTFSMLYNYSEDFQLVLSHDEVVHGKGSLLQKMPGDSLEKKAQNLRAAYGYFFSYPGKKFLFMGQDFGEVEEWSEERELPWEILKYPLHKGIHELVRDLNQLLREKPALSQRDYSPEGFEWINCSYPELSLLFFLRKAEKAEDNLLIVTNFDTMDHAGFRVGLPFPCTLRSILSSEDRKYGGSGAVRKILHHSEPIEWDERAESAAIRIPPLSTTIYQLTPLSKEELELRSARGRKEERAKKTAKKGKRGSSNRSSSIKGKKVNKEKKAEKNQGEKRHPGGESAERKSQKAAGRKPLQEEKS